MKMVLMSVALVLALCQEAQAQQYTKAHQTRNLATFEVYEGDFWQARIRAVTTQTLLGFYGARQRYDLLSGRIDALGKNTEQGALLRPGGRYEMAYRELQAGAPAMGDVTESYIKALESVLRRSKAGERFDVAAADTWLRGAQTQLLLVNLHLTRVERATRAVDWKTYSLTAGREPYLRISPTQKPYWHP
jgi:hypothetical protein